MTDAPAQPGAKGRPYFGMTEDWWRGFEGATRAIVERWVDTGTWNHRGPPPDSPDCRLPRDLCEAACREKIWRDAAAAAPAPPEPSSPATQSEMLLPISGTGPGPKVSSFGSPAFEAEHADYLARDKRAGRVA